MALPLVLLTHPLPPEWIASLQGRVRLLVGPAEPPGFASHLHEQLGEAEGILCLLTDRVDQALLDSAPRLRVVSNMAVGFDNIDIAACSRRSIPVGNTPGVLTDATADLAMALLLAAARLLPKASMDARDGFWTTWSPTGWLGADLRGATLGIVGMGKIGKAVAERAQGFGLKLIYTDSRQEPEAERRFSANSKEIRVRVEASKKRLTTVTPRSVGTFLMGRSRISFRASAVFSRNGAPRGERLVSSRVVPAIKNGTETTSVASQPPSLVARARTTATIRSCSPQMTSSIAATTTPRRRTRPSRSLASSARAIPTWASQTVMPLMLTVLGLRFLGKTWSNLKRGHSGNLPSNRAEK